MRFLRGRIKDEIRLLLMFFFVLVLIKTIISFLIPSPIYLPDERQYLEAARSFLRTGNFNFEEEKSHRYPLYSVIISPATFFKIIVAYPLIKIMNSLLSSTIIFPVWLISREFLGRKRALTTATLSAFIPESFAYTFTIMSENLFYPLFALSVYFMLKSLTEKNRKWDILCGLFVGLLILTRIIGLTLLFAIPMVLLLRNFIDKPRVKFKKKMKSFFLEFSNKWSLFLTLFIVITPWFLRNVYNFGFSFYGLMGYKKIYENTIPTTTTKILPELMKFGMINAGYIVFATGVLFFALTIFLTKNLQNWKGKKEKLSNFVIITWVLFITFVTIGTIFSFTNSSGVFIGNANKLLGRYVASVLPLFLITGVIGLSLYDYKNDRRKLIIPMLISSLFLAFLPTDKMIASFDTLSTNIIFVPNYTHRLGFLPFLIPDIVVKMSLILLPFIFYVGSRYLLGWRYALILLLIFFMANSAIATISLYIGSYDAQEYMDFAMWMRSTIPKESVVLFDKRSNDPEDELFWMIEAVKFWTDNEVIVGDVNILDEDTDYIISRHTLNLPLITELKAEEGVFDSQTETIFLYEKK